ncbi:MAG: FapA family protein [Treponema sp.]|jgi:uncharacterized protein (DUF342 family)|nr:FapA family protein [Treponema sp.]
MAGPVIAKGGASICINPQETEAKLVFIPDPDGLGWDADAVNKLAGEHNLSPPLNPKILEPFLQKAGRAKSKDPLELILYQGIPPEEPVPESAAWEALPVPAGMAPYQEETLAAAPQPELYRIRIERIKNEKKVKKPGALPFMPAKEETVVAWDKKEIRERVTVGAAPEEVKYADKGTKLGTLTPPKPGKSGKSVLGRPLQPQAAGEGGFLLGNGISRNKGDLVAQVSGFIRIGKNWADVVPLSKPSWEISAGSDGITLFFNFEPGDARFAPPTGEAILEEAKAKGAPEGGLVTSGSLDKVIAGAVKTGTPVQAFPLFQPREALARVDVNPEKTRAVLYLRKGTAGYQPLEMKAISQAVKDSKVQGYDAEKLKAAVSAFMQGKELELKDYVLAEGAPSTRGREKEVQLSLTLLSEEERKPLRDRLNARPGKSAVLEGLSPDEATGFAFVEKGAVIAQVTASSDGEPGKDVYGNVIPGLPGNDPDLKLFRGLEQHGAVITAAMSGLLLVKTGEGMFRAEVTGYRDAGIAIRVSEDAMEACGDLLPEAGGGVPLSPENVLKALAALGVSKGINKETVEKACALAKVRGSCSGVILAKGALPVAKGGNAVKWLVPVTPPQLTGGDGTGGGPGRAVQVKAGTPIVELSGPESVGRPGFDIKGREIPADKGAILEIEHDGTIKEEPLGAGKRLAAALPGELSFDGKVLKIAPLREIGGDVGPATGNITFSGEICIGGKVLPGFAVIGGRHVLVSGSAESALISAGGRAVVAQGIKGGGKGVVRARISIEAAFAEKATLMAVGDIKLKNGSVLSYIKTNGKLVVEAGKGRLLGGVCQARHGVEAANIGSETGGRTEISFGQDYLIKDQIGVTEEEISKTREAIAKTDDKIKRSLKSPSVLEALRAEKVGFIKKLEQLNLKIFTLSEKFEEYHESEIRIRGAVYPGVVIESHGRYYEVQQTRSRVVFYFDRKSGRIKEKALE